MYRGRVRQDLHDSEAPGSRVARISRTFSTASREDVLRGVVVAAVMFVMLGTVAALWANPFFMRMTPTSGFEVALLLLQSALAGIYVGLPAPTATAAARPQSHWSGSSA